MLGTLTISPILSRPLVWYIFYPIRAPIYCQPFYIHRFGVWQDFFPKKLVRQVIKLEWPKKKKKKKKKKKSLPTDPFFLGHVTTNITFFFFGPMIDISRCWEYEDRLCISLVDVGRTTHTWKGFWWAPFMLEIWQSHRGDWFYWFPQKHFVPFFTFDWTSIQLEMTQDVTIKTVMLIHIT